MSDYRINWIGKDGQVYDFTVIAKRHHPAAIQYAAVLLAENVAHPNDPTRISPVAPWGFYVTEAN